MNHEQVEQTAETLAPALHFIEQLIEEQANHNNPDGLRTIGAACISIAASIALIFEGGPVRNEAVSHFVISTNGLLFRTTLKEQEAIGEILMQSVKQIAVQQQAEAAHRA